VWNKKEMTEQCLNSIFANTGSAYGIIIIDNASDGPTAAYLDEVATKYPDKIRIIKNRENVGNVKAVNQGIAASRADYACILDNDTLVFNDWLGEMIRIAESSRDIGVVGPHSNYGRKKPWNRSYQQYAGDMVSGKQGRYIETAAVIGFCYLIKRKVIDEIGVWDEHFSPGYFEDTEYCLRAGKAGYRSVFAKGAFVFHFEHTSFKTRGFETLFKQSEEKFYSLHKRPQKILYVLSKVDTRFYNRIKEESYNLAKDCNWVWVFLKKSAPNIDLCNHTHIKKYRLPDIFFTFITTIKILAKKKKFSRILVDDGNLGKVLGILKRCHKAEVRLL
jgi:GT2 family glycosyltransferase